MSEGTEFLFLVKPQFECTREDLDRNGLIKDPQMYEVVEKQIKEVAKNYFKSISNYFACEILGKDGNQEFFIYGKK